ncbi:P-loop containing nucleoside triphosphate hydrolase protein [Infundibulicybe gibba]|nr:P-loop containing nucleoside triphosphate hydrolase protein [Infundibulicybe gibba]
MPSNKLIRLFAPEPKNSVRPRKKVPWVDVDDDEGRRRKTPLKVNGYAPNTPSPSIGNGRNGRKHKKARHSLGKSTSESPELPTTPQSAGPSNSKSSALQQQRRQLPIAKGREALIEEIRRNDITVLLGETGSGKTTQVPQYLLESGLAGQGVIAVTQPRKVAATSLASRVAAEQETAVGKGVGYSVRFDERSSPETRIKYLTDGMIVRELLSDSLLSKYSVVILRTDLLLANLKTIQRQRNAHLGGKGKNVGSSGPPNPLKIIIMSATLDAEKFSRFFNNAKIVYIKGRQHPGVTDYMDAAMRTSSNSYRSTPRRCLNFPTRYLNLTRMSAILTHPRPGGYRNPRKIDTAFATRLPQERHEVLICPMYAAQAAGQNSKVFIPSPPNTRKCILATNIAETSITIPGVKYVIDTGKCKEKQYLARGIGGGFDTLLTKDITKSAAMQRAGRAGREVWNRRLLPAVPRSAFNEMAASAQPEILRCSLASIASALKTLYLLGALNTKGELTDLGRSMAAFPLEPSFARIVIASKDYNCTLEALDIVSQRDSALEARRKFRHGSGDHLTILNAVRAYQDIAASERKSARRAWCRQHFLNERTFAEAMDIRDQLRQTCVRVGIDWKASCGEAEEPVLRCLAHGLAQNSALLQPNGSYKQAIGHSVIKIHPSSTLCDKRVPAVLYDELTYTNQIYARGVTSIPKSILISLAALNVKQA